jgi:hypothetical protein
MRLFSLRRCLLLSAAALALILTFSCSDKGEKYDPNTQFRTEDGCVYDKCGGREYNPETQYCASDSNVYDVLLDRLKKNQSEQAGAADNKCGGETYDPERQFCHEGAVTWKCGSKVYDPKKYGCTNDNEEILYDKEVEFFFMPIDSYNGVVYKKCGGKEYSPATQFCEGDKVHDYKCGDTKYNNETQFCHQDKVYDKCVSELTEPATRSDYNPDTQRCQGGQISER